MSLDPLEQPRAHLARRARSCTLALPCMKAWLVVQHTLKRFLKFDVGSRTIPAAALLSNPKVTFSPRICSITAAPLAALARSAAEQIAACLKGEMPSFAVNPEAWTGAAQRARCESPPSEIGTSRTCRHSGPTSAIEGSPEAKCSS
jgi:hypothetical protein